MISEEISNIEDIEFRIERAERRGMDELTDRLRDELAAKRRDFLKRLIHRQEEHEDDTFAQRARRWNYQDLIDEQRAALEEENSELVDKLTIGDMADITQ